MIRLVESILRTALRIYLNLSSQPKGGLTGQWVSWFFHILLMVSGCFSKEVLKTRSNLTRGFWWLQSGLDRVRWSFKWLQSGQEEQEARGGGKYLGWFVGQPDHQTWTGLSTFEQQTVGTVLIWLKPDPYREFRGKGKNTIDRIKLRHTGWHTVSHRVGRTHPSVGHTPWCLWHWNASSTSTKRLDDNEMFFCTICPFVNGTCPSGTKTGNSIYLW